MTSAVKYFTYDANFCMSMNKNSYIIEYQLVLVNGNAFLMESQLDIKRKIYYNRYSSCIYLSYFSILYKKNILIDVL